MQTAFSSASSQKDDEQRAALQLSHEGHDEAGLIPAVSAEDVEAAVLPYLEQLHVPKDCLVSVPPLDLLLLSPTTGACQPPSSSSSYSS